MDHRQSTKDQLTRFHERGYYIARGVLNTAQTEEIRAGLMRGIEALARKGDYSSDHLLESSVKGNPETVPLQARFRKLNDLDLIPELWNHWIAGSGVMDHARTPLGESVLSKYCSAFFKPARVGGATPWHQDIGLWEDSNVDAFSGWLAVDAATRANGCLQFVPGSHQGDIVPHVTYEDSIHAELPRDRCEGLAVEHIELDPGDVVFWHSKLWHSSPPNTSEQGRIGVGAVWINPSQIDQLTKVNRLRWAMRNGNLFPYPAPQLIVSTEQEGAVGSASLIYS